MPENKIEEPQKLQWIKGDNQGNVEVKKGEEGEFTLFESGKRIYTNLIGEFLQPIDDEIAEALAPPLEINSPTISPAKQPAKVEKSALRTLLDKQKKLDKVPMGISFSVNIPKKKVIDVLESTFDPEELHTELKNFIEDQIDIEEVVNTVKDSIKILIQEKYKGV
tara:strand:+ start:75 stop:569 length:495 start_codon:yes stop_codon:yes gene_type:complete